MIARVLGAPRVRDAVERKMEHLIPAAAEVAVLRGSLFEKQNPTNCLTVPVHLQFVFFMFSISSVAQFVNLYVICCATKPGRATGGGG